MTAGVEFGAGAYESFAEAVGHTPVVRLNRVTAGVRAAVYVKLEYLNPGGSVKDRAALGMLRAAEESGELRPGGTVVEASSGNTGLGLAALAAARGYRTIVVVPDRVSQEKKAVLRAYGAEVRETPGLRPVGHPEHLRSVALRLVAEIPGAWFAGQYDNPANTAAHRATTGPEIWAQTGGRVTHFVAGVGTGGTITGAGEFLKEASGGTVRVIGSDPETSVYGGGDGRIWYVEAVGHFRHPETVEDLWPEAFHPEVVDRIERIPDVEAIGLLHRLAREEGLLLGGSSGTAIAAALRVARELGPDDVVVVIAPDSGRAYLSKYYNDEWLGTLGFPLANPVTDRTVGEVFSYLDRSAEAVSVGSAATVAEARQLLGDDGILPIMLQRTTSGPAVVSEIIGSVAASDLVGVPDTEPVTAHADEPLPLAGLTESARGAAARLVEHHGPVVLVHEGRAIALVDAAALRAGVRGDS